MIPAMLTHSAPNLDAIPPHWLMEPKLDGWRWQVEITDTGVKSGAGRNGTAYSVPPVEQALAGLPPGTVLDGELLPQENGHQSTRVPSLLARGGHGLVFVAFDVLMVGGVNAMDNPLTERRAVLSKLLYGLDPALVTVSPVMPIDQATFDKWLDMGLEGAVVKDPASTYKPGARTRRWLKIKPQSTDDAIVTGFDPGGGKYAGQVGAIQVRMIDTGATTQASGMTDAVRREMTDHPERWMGRRVEIAHHGLHPVSKVPRHPQYVRLREDLEGAA